MDITDNRFTLLQCIVAHPEERPSLNTLEEMNPCIDTETIQEQVRELEGHGVVERMDVDGTSRYRLTVPGRDELEGTGQFDAEDTLKHYYNRGVQIRIERGGGAVFRCPCRKTPASAVV